MRHYKIFCVNGKYGIQSEFRIFYYCPLNHNRSLFRIVFLPYYYHIIKVGGVSFRLVLVLHAPAVVGKLYGCLNGAVAVFTVQGVDGCCEACLPVAVDGVEEVGLYGAVGADVGDDDSGLLVEICGGVAPLGA